MRYRPLRYFYRDQSGGFAIIFGLTLVPLVLAVGVSIDYVRVATARTSAQVAADAAALAVASTPERANEGTKIDQLREIAKGFVDTNLHGTLARDAELTKFSYQPNDRMVDVEVSGALKTTFMAVAGIDVLSYRATARAERSLEGSTEVVLVLDNTWSMSVDGKIVALKAAAAALVKELKKEPEADVKIGVVPYADYVNVGVDNRNNSWVSVPSDSSQTTPRKCEKKDTERRCTGGEPSGPRMTCTGTRNNDGVQESYQYDCTPRTKQTCEIVTVPPYEVCSGGKTIVSKWYGCVGSRTQGDLRLTDAQPNVMYPGFHGQQCLNPIVPLTNSEPVVLAAIDGMVVNIGSYKPSTYIPAGLIWGVNVLSPDAPFTEGKAYDLNNRRPRKALVLMTDGANTMRFDENEPTKNHVPAAGNQLARTYADTLAICDYAKSQRIEVFTVSFAVKEEAAKAAMKSCASGGENNFDADSPEQLLAAFRTIADSLNTVRLTR